MTPSTAPEFGVGLGVDPGVVPWILGFPAAPTRLLDLRLVCEYAVHSPDNDPRHDGEERGAKP